MDSPRRRGRPKKMDAVEQGATIGVLATGLSALFLIPSVTFGAHWALSDEEATTLGESLQKALSTLPGNTYVDLKKYLDRFVPWVALAIVAGQIVAPRIEETQRRRADSGREDFPSGIEIPPFEHPSSTMRERSDVDEYGSQAGHPNPFESFPGAD